MQSYDVRPPDPMLAAKNFSGGNQQKLVVAREIERNPDLLLVGQPTRGVDIGAIEFIHKQIIALRDQGKAILLVSVELDEIFGLSDRIAVMFDGRIMGERLPDETDERELGLLMAGVSEEKRGSVMENAANARLTRLLVDLGLLIVAAAIIYLGLRWMTAGIEALIEPATPGRNESWPLWAQVAQLVYLILASVLTIGVLALLVFFRAPNMRDAVLVPATSIALAIIVTALVIMAIGESPLQATQVMVRGAVGSGYGWGYTLFYATNFIFTGLAVAVAFHARMFNIGGEGQAAIGGLGVAIVCLSVPWPHWSLALLAATLGAAAFGAAWAAIPAYLQAKRGSHIVITTIMFNFIASALLVYLLGQRVPCPGVDGAGNRALRRRARACPRPMTSRHGWAFGAPPRSTCRSSSRLPPASVSGS